MLCSCLALRRDSVSATLRSIFPQQNHVYVCEWCHQACLRQNGAAEAWAWRRENGLLKNAAQLVLLSAAPVRPCADSGWTEASEVHRGRCLPCYMRARPTRSALHPTCSSAIHGDVSTDKKPTVHPSPGILPILWLGPKAAEKAGLSRLRLQKVLPARCTLSEKRNHEAALSATRADLAAADCTPAADARAQPTAPAAGALVGRVTGTVGHSSLGVGADHAPAQVAGTAADGEPVTAADCASAPAVQCAPAVVSDGASIAAADCAPALALDRARVAIGVFRPAQPCVDSVIETVAAAYGTMTDNQRQSVGTILRAHLMPEKPSALRARAGNGSDRLYTRETVPLKAVFGRRHARRPSLEASTTVARLCRDDEAAVEAVLKSVCRRARESGILAVVPSAAITALPVRLQTQFLVASSISYETWGRIRRLMGGSLNGLESAPAMRADGKAAYSEPRNRVTSTPVGATLVSLRAALEALVENLVARNQFIERPVSGLPTGEILLAVGWDKGGRQSSCKAILACSTSHILAAETIPSFLVYFHARRTTRAP